MAIQIDDPFRQNEAIPDRTKQIGLIEGSGFGEVSWEFHDGRT